jgi:hypothetical protein
MTEERALTIAPGSYDELIKIATAMAQSKFFSDVQSISQAYVKIQAGKEFGFEPFASMTGIHIIKGKPSLGANLMAAAVKTHPKYDYRVVELNDEVCEIAYFENAQELGRSLFTKEDAVKAGTRNMNTFPRNMLFARAMSNGVRWYCPDVFMGSPVYTPDELGATLDAEGSVIDVTPTVKPPEPTPPPTAGNAVTAISEVFDDEAGAEYAAEARPLPEQKPHKAPTFLAETLDQVVQAGYAKDRSTAARRLGKSQVLGSNDAPDVVVGWAGTYDALRKAGKTSDESAAEADAELYAEMYSEDKEAS